MINTFKILRSDQNLPGTVICHPQHRQYQGQCNWGWRGRGRDGEERGGMDIVLLPCLGK